MGVINGNPATLNVRQSVFAAKSPNLMSAECTTLQCIDKITP